MSMPSLGVIFHPKFPPETLADYARQAESAGFDELWLWDDCFLPGALTSAAIALSATQTLKVGIGLLPAPAYNPLFLAMEITTLARAFPGRILPGFGHGVGPWMTQIGAAPKSSLKSLTEVITAVRQLLNGQSVTIHGEHVHLDQVQMQLVPASVPPFYVGAMRTKSLQLAGRMGDGTILTGMSSPAYVRWAREHIKMGMAESGRQDHRVAVYFDVKVGKDGDLARAATRHSLARRLPWAEIQLEALGITREVAAFLQKDGPEGMARHMPDEWLDAFSAVGTPEQVADGIQRLADAALESKIKESVKQMLLELLKSKAVEKKLLQPEDEIDLEKAFLLVRDMPYIRASSRDPVTIINEWRGTCSGKHYLLKGLFAELGYSSRVIACTTVTHLDPKKVFGKLRRLLKQSDGRLVDVHNYLILELPGGEMIVDATWPLSNKGLGVVVNERFVLGEDQKIALEPRKSWVVPDDRDPQEFKNEILKESFTAEELAHRDEFLTTLSKITNNRVIKFLVSLKRFVKGNNAG